MPLTGIDIPNRSYCIGSENAIELQGISGISDSSWISF